MASAKHLWISAALLVGTVLFFGECGAVDLWVQQHFFDPATGQWIVDGNDPVLKFFFYDGIKRLIIVANLFVLIALVVWWKKEWLKPYRRGLAIVVASAILVPSVVGELKSLTNIPCPKNLQMFGGEYPHTCVWESYPKSYCPKEKMKCWPAGHASGGFALLSLVFLFKNRKAKFAAAVFALTLGWSMGLYKMMIGDHFLSHTMITMVLAWFLILLIVRSANRAKRFLRRFRKGEQKIQYS